MVSDTYLNDQNPMLGLAIEYLNALLAGNRSTAVQLIMNTVENGTSIKDIYLRIFQPCLYEIGRLWQINEVSVAQEHYCTAVTQLVMSQLYPFLFNSDKNGQKMVATCVDGELHEIGVRMVADFFELEGWDTHYLGANTPVEGILETIDQFRPHILAISVAMTFNVGAVKQMILRIKESLPNDTKIIVGGRPFNLSTNLWESVMADGMAADAQEAILLAARLMNES